MVVVWLPQEALGFFKGVGMSNIDKDLKEIEDKISSYFKLLKLPSTKSWEKSTNVEKNKTKSKKYVMGGRITEKGTRVF